MATGARRAPVSQRVQVSVGRGIGASRKSSELRWIFHERLPDEPTASAVPPAIELAPAAAAEQAVVESKLRGDLAREQRARLESELARRHSEELLALVSQELRGSLRLVKDSLAPLSAPGASALAPQARERSLLTRDVQAMSLTLERLLAESSARGAALSPDLSEVDVLELTHRVIERSEGIASFSGARIEASLSRPLPVVRGDPARLAQLLQTVLECALRLAPHGGIVAVAASADAQHVEISVRDGGRGRHPEARRLNFRARAPAGFGSVSLARHLAELPLWHRRYGVRGRGQERDVYHPTASRGCGASAS